MNLKQLTYFVAIAEERQISAAAKKLHIAQPPLSYELRLLEKELDTVLVKRGPRNSELTDAGKLLYERAKQILNMTSATTREIESFGKGISGVLSLGAISSCGGLIPGTSMSSFIDHFPNVRFELHEGNTFAIIDMLEKGIIDLGIVRTPFRHNGLSCCFSKDEPMMAVMTKEHLYGKHPNTISLSELENAPLIIYRRFESLIHEAFHTLKITPFISCLNDDARTTFIWAKKGFGVGLVPKSILQVLNMDNMITKAITDPVLTTQIAVIWKKDRYLSPLAKQFVLAFEQN